MFSREFKMIPLALSMLVAFGISTSAQVTADNGLSASGSNVQLGGTLLQNTTIDLGGFDFHLKNGNTPLFTTLANGNVGLGVTAPGARLSFPDVSDGNDPVGITWYSPSPTTYGIHRTTGPWTGPDFQQLKLDWNTGILLDPGVSYGKSYVDIVGNGLRVTQGNVGIGTITTGTAALAIERSNNDGGGITDAPLISLKNTSTFAPAGSGYNTTGINFSSGNGVVLGQCVSNYGIGEGAPWNAGSGFYITTRTDHPIIFATGAASEERARILSNGNILIGASTDNGNKLQVNGSVWTNGLVIPSGAGSGKVLTSDANGNATWQVATGGSAAGWGFGGNSVPASTALGTTSNFDLPIITNNTEQMRIGANGNVGIGTTNIANYKLSVNGNIRTRKVHIDQDAWADYVFEKNYQLRSINELEQYIQQQKHLPDVPSAAEVKKEGLDLGDNQAVLLKKIEELTLYVIEQNKKIEELQKLVLQQKDKEAQGKESKQ